MKIPNLWSGFFFLFNSSFAEINYLKEIFFIFLLFICIAGKCNVTNTLEKINKIKFSWIFHRKIL